MNEINSSDGKENQRNEELNDSLEAKKKKIKDDIRELKDLIYEIESNTKITKFKEIQKLIEPEESFSINNQMIQNITDTETNIQNDLYRFMGFYCTKCSDSYIFNFISTPICTKDDVYSVELLNEDGVVKLGKWLMPFSIDVNQIFKETSLEKVHDIPLFLRNCKRKLDYHYSRVIQFQDFKAFLCDFKNCKLDTSLGYTQIMLELIGVMEIESGRNYNIVLYFYYESDDVRPRILEIDSLTDTKLSDEEVQKFKKFFKYFKNFELKVAFETALNATHTVFLWNKEPAENNLIESSDNDANISKSKRKRKIQSKESKKKRQRIDESNTLNLHSSGESGQEDYHSESENISQTNFAEDNKKKAKKAKIVKSKTSNIIQKFHGEDFMESKNDSKELLSNPNEKRKTKMALKEAKDSSKILKKKSKSVDPKQRTLNFGTTLEKSVDKIKNKTAGGKSIKWADEILEKEKENESASVITNANEDAFIPTSTPIKKNKKDDQVVPDEQEISVIDKATDAFPDKLKNKQNVQSKQVTKDSQIAKDSNDSGETDYETEVEMDIDQKALLDDLKSVKENQNTANTKKLKGKSLLSIKKVTKTKKLKNKK